MARTTSRRLGGSKVKRVKFNTHSVSPDYELYPHGDQKRRKRLNDAPSEKRFNRIRIFRVDQDSPLVWALTKFYSDWKEAGAYPEAASFN